jgi:small ligand-binding sensory domain FIST
MLAGLTRHLDGRRPQSAVSVSCLACGSNLFGSDAEEPRQVQAAVGNVPLVGFFANGEISHDHGHTGMLTATCDIH